MKHTLPHSLIAITLVIMAIQLATAPSSGAQSSSIVWSEPTPIGEDLPSSWFPEVQTDPYGTVRLVWEAVRDASDPAVTDASGGAIMLSEYRDGAWSTPHDILIKDTYNAARPILASDEKYLHLISRSPKPERRITLQTLAGMYYMRAPLSSGVTSANSWSEPIRLTNGSAYWAQLLALPGGRLVVAYNQVVDPSVTSTGEIDPADIRTALFVRTSNDYGTTWEQPIRLSYTENRVARSSLVVSPADGTLILAWDEGYDNLSGMGKPAGIFTAKSSDSGTTWAVEGKLDPAQPSERLMSMAGRGSVESSTLVATNDLVMLTYRALSKDVILYRLSHDQGRSWSEEMEIPQAVARPYTGPHNFEKLALVADSAGRIILAYVGQDPESESGLGVFSATFENDKWSKPQLVASPEGFPEYPRLTVAQGNQVHLAFFVRDELNTESGHFVIWTTTGTTPAPVVEPLTKPVGDQAVGEPIPAATEPDDSTAGIQIRAYPTPPKKQEPIGGYADQPPMATVTKPIVLASIVTAGLLVAAVVTSRVLKRLTGF